MGKVVCIGEALVDFLPTDGGALKPMAGGAPANVCACISKLGGKALFLGKLSRDEYGKFLASELQKSGVDLSAASFCDNKTAYSVVELKDGDRSFSFFRENTADLELSENDVPEGLFSNGDILHFCSVSLVESPAKYAHKRAAELALSAGATISFDVNLRPSLWNDSAEMKKTVKEFLKFADIVKVSEEELDYLANGSVDTLFKTAENAKIVLLTLGKDGATAYDRYGGKTHSPAYCKTPVDTTGAGDCFMGGVLLKLSEGGASLSADSLKTALDFASKACAISVSRKGAIESYPTLAEIENN